MFKRKFDSKPLGILFTLLVAVCLSAFALTRSDEWTLNPSDFRYDMSLYFSVDPAEYADLNTFEIGAFVGDECRGTAQQLDLPEGGSCLYMRIRSNSSAGDEIHFMVRERATGKITVLKGKDGKDFSFKSDELVGLPSNPYEMTPYFQVKVSAGEHGTVAPVDGLYAFGSQIELNATPDEGYHFAGWSDDVIDNPRTVIVSEDVDLTASFAISSYEIIMMVDNEEYMRMEFEYGAPISLPEGPTIVGQTFVRWENLPEPSTMPAHDVVVYAMYSVNSYQLTLTVDGVEYSVQTLPYGSKIELPEMAEKEGYTFSGWGEVPETMPDHNLEFSATYTLNTYKLTLVLDGKVYRVFDTPYGTPLNRDDFDGAEPDEREGFTFAGWGEVPETMPAHDVELTGSFTVNTYKLTFVLDGASYEVKTVAYGDKIEVPVVPEKEGYTFSGWGNVPEAMPARDVELNGKYEINTYKLTLILDGKVYRVFDTPYGTPLNRDDFDGAEPDEREGYTFAGWGEVPETMPARDVELTGSFTVNTYRVNFIIDGVESEVKTVAYGDKIEVPVVPEKEGYTFSGWGTIPETMPAQDLSFNGKYVANVYKLTLVLDGEQYEVKDIAYGEKLEVAEPEAREGYTFSGWGTIPETMPAQDVELTGSFTVNTYKLTLLLNGEVYEILTLAYGEKLNLPTPPENEGSTFGGWDDAPETMPAHDLELTGDYDFIGYKLTFMLDGEIFAMKTVLYGDKIELVDAPEKEGYTFKGWGDVPEKMPARDVELTGLYEPNTYNLTLIIDGEEYKVLNVAYGEKLEVAEPEAREGYTFSGWGTIPETMPAQDVELTGSFTVNTYNLTLVIDGVVNDVRNVAYGEKIEVAEPEAREGYTFSGWGEVPETMPATDVVLEGEYTVNTYKLTLFVDGELYKEEDVAYGTELKVVEPEAREGYTFSGWGEVLKTMPAHDVELQGQFNANIYNLTLVLDGEVYEVRNVSYGEKLEVAEPEAREGYTFSGWGEVPETMPATDVVLEGEYTVNTYKLTLFVDGELYKEEDVAYGTELKVAEPEAREGYTFSGWGEVLKTMPAHDVELQGQFVLNTYKLTLLIDGEVYEVRNVSYGEKLEVAEPEAREGYTFSGWGEMPETMPAQDVEISGEYTVNFYKLTVYVDNELYMEEMLPYGSYIEIPDPEAPEGMIFEGWQEIIPETMPAFDLVITGTFGIETGLNSVGNDGEETFTVYTLNGMLICKDVPAYEVKNKLQSGLYIINGKKVLVK